MEGLDELDEHELRVWGARQAPYPYPYPYPLPLTANRSHTLDP